MTYDILLALAGFAIVTLFTPGPNNLMLMASGANFGLRRSLPHLCGVWLGFPMMILPVGFGVMQVFDLWPLSYTLLKVASVAYMAWLAWKIAHAAPPEQSGDSNATPLSFLQAVAFQWVNPKAWSMALGAITLYAASRDVSAILIVAGAFMLFGGMSAMSWTFLGQKLRRLLNRPARLRLFNWTMAGLLVISVAPVLQG